jgi:predicted transcriptional regulator
MPEKLPTVFEFMDRTLDTLSPGMDIYDAVEFLLDHRVTGAPVVDARGKLVGILTEKNCLRLLTQDEGASEGHVEDYMDREFHVVPPEMDIYYAAGIFLKIPERRMPVIDAQGGLVGQVTRRDILRVIRDLLQQETEIS